MEIIDSHCHIYPEKIANKAVGAIGDFYGIEMKCKGTSAELLEILNKNNITKAVIHSTATKPEQVPSINDFIINTVETSNKFIGFGTMHPDYDKLDEEFDKMLKNGLKGIKIHPDFQMRNIDDKSMDTIYEIVGDKMPVLFHIGDKRKDFSNPQRLKNVMKRFPKLKPIAAHLGGYSVWLEALEILKDENVWVDTCSSFNFLDDSTIIKLINTYGIEKVLFATDYPMWDFNKEYERLMSLNLKNSDLEKIFSKNIKSLINI